MSDLTFGRLRDTNVRRCEEVFHKLDDWTTTDWTVALFGEVGEALEVFGRFLSFANNVKKLRRLDGADAGLDTQAERDRLVGLVMPELADMVIYADLLAAHLRRGLGDAVTVKFNEVSVKRGSKERL